jgi:hypothetical protein
LTTPEPSPSPRDRNWQRPRQATKTLKIGLTTLYKWMGQDPPLIYSIKRDGVRLVDVNSVDV